MSRTIGFRATILVYILGFAVGTLAVDSDQDGVEDGLDVCCDTPSGITVDEDGRPVGDFDDDCDGDLDDFLLLHMDLGGPGSGMDDLRTFATFQVNSPPCP